MEEHLGGFLAQDLQKGFLGIGDVSKSMNTTIGDKATFSIPSIIAIAAAFLSFNAGAAFGFVLALIAIVFGVIGVTVALSPDRRGGMASTIAVLAGAIGIVVALVKAISWLF